MTLTSLITALFLLYGFSTQRETQQTECKNPLIDSIAVVKCISIIDGDTWKFKLGRDVFSVRVLGIDCYETKHNARLQKQADRHGITKDSALILGLRAKKIADSLLTGKEIIIIRDFKESNFDVYNRLLRHCYFEGMINYAELIKLQGLNAYE